MSKFGIRLVLILMISLIIEADPQYDLPLAYKIELNPGEKISEVAIVLGSIFVKTDQGALFYFNTLEKLNFTDRIRINV